MRGQVSEREGGNFPFVQVSKLEGLEVAHQNVARALALGKCVEVLPGLLVGGLQVAPSALLFDD